MKITDVKLVPFLRPLGGKAAEIMIKGPGLGVKLDQDFINRHKHGEL